MLYPNFYRLFHKKIPCCRADSTCLVWRSRVCKDKKYVSIGEKNIYNHFFIFFISPSLFWQGCIFFCLLPNYMLGEKIYWKGDEKRGERVKCIFFPQLVKVCIFSPQLTENVQNCPKKAGKFFSCGAHHLNIINFIGGKNINQEGGGGAKIWIQNLIYTPVLWCSISSLQQQRPAFRG